MSYTKVVYSNDNQCFNGQYNDNPDNQEFVKLRDVLSAEKYCDYVIAEMCDIAASTFSKIKLGYYKPTQVQLTALRYAVKKRALKSKADSKDTQPSVGSACTRDGNAYVTSPVAQKDEVIKPITDSKPTVNKPAKPADTDKAIVINVPANFSGSITINVK